MAQGFPQSQTGTPAGMGAQALAGVPIDWGAIFNMLMGLGGPQVSLSSLMQPQQSGSMSPPSMPGAPPAGYPQGSPYGMFNVLNQPQAPTPVAPAQRRAPPPAPVAQPQAPAAPAVPDLGTSVLSYFDTPFKLELDRSA